MYRVPELKPADILPAPPQVVEVKPEPVDVQDLPMIRVKTPPTFAAPIKIEPPEIEQNPLYAKYDWLSAPIGRFDFENAGRPFRSSLGAQDKKFIAQYTQLLEQGYKLLHLVPNGNTIYLVFEKP